MGKLFKFFLVLLLLTTSLTPVFNTPIATRQAYAETCVYYAYDPEIGRFISRDPVEGTIANPQSQNPYTYAWNNPINLSDPSGEQVANPSAYGPGAMGIGLACLAGSYYYATNPSFRDSINNAVGTAISNVGVLLDKALSGGGSATTSQPGSSSQSSKQFKKLNEGEIKKLQEGGEDIHQIKNQNSGQDLYKDPKTGDIYIKPSSGSGPGEPTGLNINDY